MASRITPEQQNYNLIGSRLSIVRSEVAYARNRRPKHILGEPTMILITENICPEMIHRAYDEGARHFAEYSIPELATKSNCGLIKELCPDIQWHFIGSLQTTRIGRLASINNIYMIHTIERPADADILESALRRNNSTEPLNVTVQVNTSRISTRGVLPEDADRLVSHLLQFCPHLHLKGLMTAGSYHYDEKNDFITLTHLREVLQKQFSITLDIVMGWSRDFKTAIHLGSNFVRMEERVFSPAEKRYQPIKTQL